MVNTSLKKRTTPTAILEGSWGFEHTKAYFKDEIISFVKALKDLFNTFDQYLIDELSEVQNVFHQMEQAMEQHRLESKTFEVKMNQVLNKNERLLEQVISKDIVNTIVNSSVDIAYVNVHECEKCLKLETGLLNKKDFIKKEIYDKLFKSFTTLEKHCIYLEVDTQHNHEIFQRDNSISNQSALSFDQLFELKAQSQEKDMVIKKLKERIKSLSRKMNEDKIKNDLEDIETINIELDHRVSKLIAENEHLKQTYKQLYDLIKPTPLKDDLRKLKEKALVDNVVTKHTIDPEMLKIDVEPITSKLYAKLIQEFLTHISKTCPSVNNTDEKLVAVTPKNKDKRVRFTKPVTSLGNTITKTASTSNLVSNKPMLSYTGVKPSTSASGSQPSDKTKKDKIRQTPSSTQKNKVEAHPRKVKSSLKNKDCVVQPKGTAHVQHSKLNANSELKCKSSKRKVWKPTGKVFINIGYIWRPTGQTITIIGNACPLTRITTTTEVPLRKPTALENETPKPVITLVYSRKPRKSQTNVPVRKSKIGNVTISRVYYVKGLGHNLFFVGKFCDSNLEVAFHQHTCFIRNLEGVDLLTGYRGNNLHTLSLGDMMASSLISRNGLVQEAVATACYTQNRSIIRLRHDKTPYELLHDKLPDLSFFYVFGALCYPTNDSENLNFDELTAIASEHSSPGPVLHEMTPATNSSGLVPNPDPSTLFVPPSRTD
ncbi:hypothetical protein Tco_1341259 [Tanacetum coccineum]